MTRLYSKLIDNCCDCANCGEAGPERAPRPICWAMEGKRENNWLEWGDFEFREDGGNEHITPPDWCPLPVVQEGQE